MITAIYTVGHRIKSTPKNVGSQCRSSLVVTGPSINFNESATELALSSPENVIVVDTEVRMVFLSGHPTKY